MTNNKQQTAVEWLENELERIDKEEYYESIEYINAIKKAFEKAKEMEKEQIRKAYCYGEHYKDTKLTTDYYNETYGKNHIGDVNKMVGGEQ